MHMLDDTHVVRIQKLLMFRSFSRLIIEAVQMKRHALAGAFFTMSEAKLGAVAWPMLSLTRLTLSPVAPGSIRSFALYHQAGHCRWVRFHQYLWFTHIIIQKVSVSLSHIYRCTAINLHFHFFSNICA